MQRIGRGLLAACTLASLIAWSAPADASECPKIRYQIKYQGAMLEGRKTGLPPEKWSRLNVSPRPVFEREINQDASETVNFRTDHQQVERC